MSKASIRKHARDRRRHDRARRTLHRSRHRRQVLSAILSSGSRTADFSVWGLHIKTLDVDEVVDENIGEKHPDYAPASDGTKKMCDDLSFCGQSMNNLLIETAAKLKLRDWDFTYDDKFISDAQGLSVVDFKVAVYGNTQ